MFILRRSESPTKITLIRLEFASGSVGYIGAVGLFLDLDLFRGSEFGTASVGFASSIDLVVSLSVIIEHSWLDSSGIITWFYCALD